MLGVTFETEPPAGLKLERTTPVFSRESVPKGLLRAHTVAAGVWGKLVVLSGELLFVFEDTVESPIHLRVNDSVAIPPSRPHHLELDSPATFVIEFYK